MIDINLLPDSILKYRSEAQLKKRAQYIAIVAVSVIALISAGSYFYKLTAQQLLSSAEEKKVEVEGRVNSPENVAFREEAITLQTSLQSLQQLFSSQKTPTELLDTLASLTPPGVKLQSVSSDQDGLVTISGIGTSVQDVSTFIAALKRSQALVTNSDGVVGGNYFTGLILNGVSAIEEEGSSNFVQQFELIAIYVDTSVDGLASEIENVSPSIPGDE